MKKYLKFFMLMLLVFNYSYSVSKIMPETDWKVKKLKGKVKTMVSKIDEYDYSGKVRAKIEIVTNFNESGYIIEEVNYYNGDKKQIYSNKYNKDGNEIEWAWITYSPEEQIQSFILYSGIKKDKYGNLIEKTGKYLEITDGGKKLGKESGVIAEEMKIEYKYYE